MKILFVSAVLALGWFGLLTVKAGAQAKDATGEDAAKAALAGDYVGTWTSSTGDAGKLWITLKPHGSGWGAEGNFSYEDVEASTRITSVKVEGMKVELEFNWEHRGTPGKSRLSGEVAAGKISGTYESKANDEESRGKWTVEKKP